MTFKNSKWQFWVVMLVMTSANCKKLVSVGEPVSTITTPEVFSRDDQAVSAIAGIYASMANSGLNGCSGAVTIYCGLSADELSVFDLTDLTSTQFWTNSLQSKNDVLYSNLWKSYYSFIYKANAAIEGLSTSRGVHDSLKRELVGENKLVRAFCYFYLVNLFGDVPYITTTDWNKTSSVAKESSDKIIQFIISDLQDAEGALATDYSVGLGERIRPNKWCASALLARVYLYTKDWANAEKEASFVVNNQTLYNLEGNLHNAFNKNSGEAIWQLSSNLTRFPFNSTYEGYTLIPYDSTTSPSFYLSNSLLSDFETGDQRRYIWVDSIDYNGTVYYFPFKYSVGPAETFPNGGQPQYFTMLRLSEQYLILAEAKAQENRLSDAAADINMLRMRAGLSNVVYSDQLSLLSAILHERRIELFSEWGHRWFDLKRTDQATSVLGSTKPNWNSNAQLYPIPLPELQTDPNLTQNPGY